MLLDVGLLLHLVPVDPLPPLLGELELAALAAGAEPVVPQPHVLPRVEAQHGLQVDAAGGEVDLLGGLGVLLAGAVGCLVHVGLAGGEAVLVEGADGRIHVDVLAAPVGARVGGVARVGGEHLEGGGHAGDGGLDEPDEARAEHAGGGEDHLVAQCLDGAKRLLQETLEWLGYRDLLEGEVLEEELIVVDHAGMVEDDRGFAAGVSGSKEQGIFDVFVFIIGF